MTQKDLQQIAEIIDDRLEKRLEKTLDEKLVPIHKKLDEHSKMLKSLKKDQDTMLVMLDGEQMKQRKRITTIEQTIGISS